MTMDRSTTEYARTAGKGIMAGSRSGRPGPGWSRPLGPLLAVPLVAGCLQGPPGTQREAASPGLETGSPAAATAQTRSPDRSSQPGGPIRLAAGMPAGTATSPPQNAGGGIAWPFGPLGELPPPSGVADPPADIRMPVVAVMPGSSVAIAFDVRAIDVRRPAGTRYPTPSPPTPSPPTSNQADAGPAEGEIVERGEIVVPLDRQGRGAGAWIRRSDWPYFARIEPPGRYQPMVAHPGLELAAAVQPSPTPAHRWLRVTATLEEVTSLNEDVVAGTANPLVDTLRWKADLDLPDGRPVTLPFLVRPGYRTEIRLVAGFRRQ